MNNFVRINRIPLDILSLVPTHLSSHKDRFHASFVCRHWRKTFLQHGALWSQLFLKNGEDYVTTLLERAKGSALEITTDRNVPLGAITLLPPYARQIRRLSFPNSCWTNILLFPRIVSAPLPLLRTLEIYVTDLRSPQDQFSLFNPPSFPLFGSAINVEEFVLDFRRGGSLNHFVFPNLTTFILFAPQMDRLNASYLFDFLRASPTLQTVGVTIDGGVIPGSIPQDMVVILPNVETFSLSVNGYVRKAYEPAVHISCPRAKSTSLTHQIRNDDTTPDLEVFPNSASWMAITHQYTTSPVEEVTLEIDCYRPVDLIACSCSLTFRSSDATAIKLDFQVIDTDEEEEEEDLPMSYGMVNRQIFSRACRAIQGHPLLSHVKRLHFKDKTGDRGFSFDYLTPMVGVVWELFRSLGPLDELTIHGFDLRIFLTPFTDPPESRHLERVFPSVKELTVSKAWMFDRRQCLDDIVELAKSHHELGKPFERVTVREGEIPTATVERLEQWVSAVDCY